MCESGSNSLRPDDHTVWKRALLGSRGRQLARRLPASPESTSQVNPGRAADNSERCANERLRAHTCGGGPRCQTTTVSGKASKRVRRLQVERALRLPHTWCTVRQSGRDRARVQQESRDDMPASPWGPASSQDHHTGRRRRGQLSRRAMRKRKRMQCGIWHLDMEDGRILNRRWKSRSRSSVIERRRLDGLLQLSYGRRTWTQGQGSN